MFGASNTVGNWTRLCDKRVGTICFMMEAVHPSLRISLLLHLHPMQCVFTIHYLYLYNDFKRVQYIFPLKSEKGYGNIET